MLSRKWVTAVLVVGLYAPSSALFATPYTFVSGQPIRAAEINANFKALEDQLAASTRPDLVRVSLSLSPSSGAIPLLTVPGTATRPYVLREVNMFGAYCFLQVGAEQIPLVNNTASAGIVLTGLELSFSANDVISVGCNSNSNLTFVFEK